MKTIVILFVLNFSAFMGLTDNARIDFKTVDNENQPVTIENFSTFPNPSGNKIFLDLFGNYKLQNMQVTLREINGKLQETSKISECLCAEFSVDQLKRGTYLITVSSGNEAFSKILIIP